MSASGFEAFFSLDAGMHAGDIRQLALTPDGRSLLSAGECTIRVWDLRTRTLLRRLLGPVAERAEESYGKGNVRAFAISPDGRWVLALKDWWLSRHDEDRGAQAETRVELFELATGNLRRAFAHPGLLQSLDFSPDGRWLALTGHRANLREPQGELLLISVPALLGGAVDASPPIDAYPLNRSRREHDASPPASAVRWLPLDAATDGTQRLVLAVPADLHDETGADTLTWCSLSREGQLRAGAQVRCPQRLAAHTLAVSATLAVVAGLDSPRQDGRLGQFIAYTHDGHWHSRSATDAPPAALAFDALGSELIVGLQPTRLPLADPEDAQEPMGGVQLPPLGPASVIDNEHHEPPPEPGAQVVLVHAYRVCAEGMRLHSSYFGHDGAVSALTVQRDGLVWSSGGDNRALHAWRSTHRIGAPVHTLRGLGRLCTWPGITPDEQVLFGNLPERLLPPAHPPRQQRFDLRHMRLETVCPSEVGNTDFETDKWFIADLKPSQLIALRYAPDAYGDNLHRPDLTLFVAANDEWLIWSRSGFYDASAQGAKLAGYHLNRGPTQEAMFLSADRFKRFYRPDLIRAIVQHGSEERAAQAGVRFPQLRVVDLLPPLVEIETARVQPGGTRATLRFSVSDLGAGEPPQRVWILANERFVWERRLTRRRARRRFVVTLPLRAGSTQFSVLAESEQAKSMPASCTVQGSAAAQEADTSAWQTAPGRLHLLSVGVSDFAVADKPAASGFKRLQFAHRDAIAVHKALAGPGNAAFESVQARLLINEQATKAGVLNALRELCNSIQQRSAAAGAERDVLLVFLSGHGAKYPGEQDLYFFNHDMRPDDVERTGLSLIDIGQMLTSVNAEVLLVLDCCYAAAGADDLVGALDPEELAQRLHALNERGMVVLGAARADEKARENPLARLGVFTTALLQALQTRRFHEPLSAEDATPVLRVLGLMHALQALVPQISLQAGKKPQTPVCRSYGDLLPLTLYKP